jgi:hypothetical protein
MTFEEYRLGLLNELKQNASINQNTMDDEFLVSKLNLLEQLQELDSPNIYYFQRTGRGNKIMQIDGYAFDDSEKSLSIVLSDFSEDENPEPLINTKIETFVSRMVYFIEESVNGGIIDYCDDSDEIIPISKDIRRRVLLPNSGSRMDESIEKIKLYIITNRKLSTRVKKLKEKSIFDIGVDTHIYDIERFFEIELSGKETEPILIKIADYGEPKGVPCVLAEMREISDYDAYLGIIPGKLLSDIYYDHGSRLLEGNVRAFLSTRGNVNKGIRNTILKEPTRFFTYNNGIAATASKIELVNGSGGLRITEIQDFQIINGGQTTASLTSAAIKDKNSLEGIYVPFKITVVKNEEEYDDIVSFIAKYANSQNKVTAADMFSNHRFHIQMEKLSEKILAPASNEVVHPTVWYYERSRGKYEQMMFKYLTKSERDKFQRKYPKNQVIKKEELAKYWNSINGYPHHVSKGAMKNMQEFAKTIDSMWQSNREQFNEHFFRKAVASTIIFRQVDKLIYKMPWYEKGGYKANIVTYAIAKLVDSLPKGYLIDYERIWKSQNISSALAREIEVLGYKTQEFITNSGGMIVTEYCKKEDTWKKFKSISHQLSEEFVNELVDENIEISKETKAIKEEKLGNKVNNEIMVYNLGKEFYKDLLRNAKTYREFVPHDGSMLEFALGMYSSEPKLPSIKQSKEILRIIKKYEDLGVILLKDLED